MKNYISLKDLAPDDQPREKLIEKGSENLSNAELLAILIGSGTSNKSAVQLCQEILNSVDNDLNKLAKLSVGQLTKFNGIGNAKAVSIVSALEVGRRRQPEDFFESKSIKSSRDAYQAVKSKFIDKEHEEFYTILLSRANKIKAIELISKGGVNGTVADGKIIFKKALEQTASAIILCHNHPSGNLKPSESDQILTKRLIEFGKYIDLNVLDHLIVTDNGYFSFADEGAI